MDYDENDFHSQNFQLVGEDNKFPSSLRSFALPKFDFDDHLQVHLRFDSLVDTEVLLGIPGQDNNWIEDFSSGTSAIEFSSTAAENHSISRHNNVWSEATSSESVEMLLRSVGEDDMSDKKSIAMEADAQNELHDMVNQVGSPSGKVEENSMLSGILGNIPSVPPDARQRNVLGLDGNATAVHAQVEGLSQIFSSEISRPRFVASSFDGNVSPVDNDSVKPSDVHGCEENEVASGTSDSVSCRSTRADRSSGNSNLVMGSGNLNNQLLSEHLVEEHKVISIIERSDMLPDDVHKEGSLMAIDSKGCSVTGFSGSSDGLLEAIAYQVKVANNDIEAGVRSSSQVDETNSLAIDRRCINTDSVEISDKKFSDRLNDPNDKSGVDISETSVEVSVQVNETQDKNGRETNISNKGSQNPEPVLVEKSVDADGVEVEKVDSKLALEGVMTGDSILPVVSNAEVKILSSFPDESHQAAEPSDVPTPSLEVCISRGHTNLNNDGNAASEKAEDATCAGQIDVVGGSVPIMKKIGEDGPELAILSDPDVTDISSSGVMTEVMPAPKVDHDESIKFHQSQVVSASDVVLEHKERETSPSSEFVQSENISSVLKSEGKVDGQGSSRPLEVSDIGGISPLIEESLANNLDQSSSCMVSSVASQSELHVLVDKSVAQAQEHNMEVVENIVICDSAVKGKKQSDKPDASSHENRETSCSLPDAPVSLGTNTSFSLSGSHADAHLLEVDSGKLSLPEPSCGSPTVISCIEHSHDEPEGRNVEKVRSTTLDSKESSAFEDDKSFTFEVGTVANRAGKDAGNEWKPISSVQASDPPKILKENSEAIRKNLNEKKSSNEDKTSHITGSSVERLTAPKGRSGKGTSTRKKSTNSDRKSSNTSTPVRIVSSGTKLEEVQRSPFVQTSTLPDLNSSISSITSFHQPFSDIQQVQLRAQIFVYGSLIQGIPPDEACMQSAFGETDKGRTLWESVWQTCVERYQSQKSPASSETPLRSHSAVRIPEGTRSNSLQTKSASTSLKNAGKAVPSAIVNSTPPLPSPLWSISTHDALHSNFPRGAQLDFNQALSPLHAYPPSQTRQYTSSSTPWLSQNPRPGPWAVSAHSQMLNASTQYSPVSIVENVKVTPVKDSSTACAANIQLVSPTSLLPAQTSASVAPASAVQSETQRKTSTPGNSKSRKRRKAAGAEDLSQTSLVTQSIIEPASATILSATIPSALSGFPFSTVSPAKVSSEAPIIGSGNSEQRVIFSEKTGPKIEEAKSQAEEAATLAASVISSNQGIWNKLAVERYSGLSTEVEEKLTSAAVAVSAAASVAKAAASAAKIASDAALQAKMMAEEALDFEAGKNSARLTPGTVLKGKDKVHGSGSIISAAHEATRKRVEAASAAAKRAENLDAIMKAAEMAAEAVYQVGTIIAMGDPLPFKLSDLVEAGPDGYWKVHPSTSEKEHRDEQTRLNGKQIQQTKSTEDGRNHNKEAMQAEDNFDGHGTGLRHTSTIPNDSYERENLPSNLKENAILKGSLVEVLSDEDGLRGGWFSARVVDVKDNNACVCYNNRLSDDGSGQLKEWISFDSASNGAPRIRIAHPGTVTKSDGSKKRRREAVGTYVWEVGDRVDAWMRDGWWEGVVTEKSQVDDTKLTVHFPAGGDSLLVRAWDIRPSLTWKDGQWIEWSRAKENTLKLYEGDTPGEKRQKIGSLETNTDVIVDNEGMDKLSSKMPSEEPRKGEDLLPLNLSAKDKIFSVGKNTSKDNISDALKFKRTGLQKEGSRVVFGVPKPGKKRKFMEVSKHYVSEKTEATQENNDSLKFAKYLMPQTSRPWRNTTKVDSKGKPAGDSKSVGGRSVKSQTTQTRKTTEKDNSSNGRNNSRGTSPSMGGSVNNAENSANDVVSFSGSLRTTESLVVGTSLQPVHTVPPSKKKSSSSIDSDTGIKRRPASASEKSIRSEEKVSEDAGRTIAGTAEPRRSNRRIQPTSRLLEGLQSSLIISKIPSFSHDKGSKAQHRGSSSRGNARG